MAKQSVMFKFRDGLKEVKVGDPVLLVGGRRRGDMEGKVSKIGNKLITVEHGGYGESQFYIENGQQKTEYSGDSIYSSKLAYDESLLDDKSLRALKRLLERSSAYELKQKQILEAVQALGLDKEFKEYLARE